ncbi:phage tail family protein [Companilactobacillus zhachilii]|uniref:Phage tail family protein n=1 Tax=Companilactobacillus zhachilii TaxID=2304606 RepID=A0A386PR10_9LACO|nr:phage tail domain-containing protein [Companilactobacillus zhachilii]AYE38401.1 phage tail family protein [Companilactobacillus zhachilii]
MTEKVFKDESLENPKPHAYGFSNGHDNPSRLPYDPVEVAISTDGINWKSYYDVEDLFGVHCYDYDSPMTNPVDNWQKINTRDGQTRTSGSFDSRDIQSTWMIDATNESEFLMLIEELQNFFMIRGGFWIVFSREPTYKYRVVTKPIVPTYFNEKAGTFQITFNNYTGVRESVGTSLEIFDKNKNFFSYGMGMPNKDISFESKEKKFSIYNPSSFAIDPLAQHHYLKIHIRGSGSPTLTNNTTGESFTYNRVLTSSDELILDGVNPMINGTNDGINSDHGTISLAKGNNEFEISGLSNSDVSFEFYFIYN